MTDTYDPGLVYVVAGAVPINTGFAEGSMVRVARQGDGVRAVVGAAGETAFVESYDERAEVTIRMMGTSRLNSALAGLEALGVAFPFSIVSISTRQTLVGGAARIKRMPDQEFSADMPTMEWVFVVAKATEVISPV
jgi:hypothetical protein